MRKLIAAGREYDEQYDDRDGAAKRRRAHESVRDAARIELGLRAFLEGGRFQGVHRRHLRICTAWRSCPAWPCSV